MTGGLVAKHESRITGHEWIPRQIFLPEPEDPIVTLNGRRPERLLEAFPLLVNDRPTDAARALLVPRHARPLGDIEHDRHDGEARATGDLAEGPPRIRLE